MATTTVSGAYVAPQDPGTGLSSNADPNNAAAVSLIGSHEQGGYVGVGLGFDSRDAGNDTITVGSGYCYIVDDSSSTTNSRGSGGNAQVESTVTSGYDTEVPANTVYVVVIPNSVTVDVSDSQTNQIWVNITSVSNNNQVEIRSDGGGGTTAEPSDTFLKLGDANPDDASADTRANPDPSPSYDALTINSFSNSSDVVGSTEIASDAVGTSELDLSITPTWTGTHTYEQAIVSAVPANTAFEADTGTPSLNGSGTIDVTSDRWGITTLSSDPGRGGAFFQNTDSGTDVRLALGTAFSHEVAVFNDSADNLVFGVKENAVNLGNSHAIQDAGADWLVPDGSQNLTLANGGLDLSAGVFEGVKVESSAPAAGDLNQGEVRLGDATGPNSRDELFWSVDGTTVARVEADSTIT